MNTVKGRTFPKARGFTLLEMMVVLILVSLITTLMMQGFSFVMGLQERIRTQLVQVKDTELREQWFRLTVRALHRGRPNDNASFTGDEQSFSGLTLQPLFAQTGLPSNIEWRLEAEGGRTQLLYAEDEQPAVPIMTWMEEEPVFRYLDDKGQLSDRWPADLSDNGLPFEAFFNQTAPKQALPSGVVLMDASKDTPLFWYVSISSNALPTVDDSL
ncbi:prepilin-type N-terminal cleavage/methylation domain-containing protein [Alteromonas sediminis]|uniref:Prepilin-type N-terminal cleavage/methylation domain-containing protein n=1 Tax=Alteromonas sediminis TaxID=2259342 RepID=A0A3N5Y518_9ALTE|nr:prepilin-type N-terminal cleavage/methylation domain-containing protein [Alteromonas sediminis]RPJ68303.1 prepilin-type N-terminal cleavage/methylation domain-containing protein [Alteromonas sediminis]